MKIKQLNINFVNKKLNFYNLICFFSVFLCIFAIFFIPFSFSESRYAEVARKIIESKNWVTLFFEDYKPFWAKPPFAMWLAAIGMKLFGINEFGARIIGFLFSLLCVLRLKTRIIILSTPAFLIVISALMTDGCLVGCLSLCFVGASKNASKFDKLLFFVGLGIGILTKGPFCLFIVFGSLTFFFILERKIELDLPFFIGLLITSIIALPWYILCEIKTPGFLNYFIVGEHFLRFTQKGWSGDMYGRAHSSSFGIIWVYFFIICVPFVFFFKNILKQLFKYKSLNKSEISEKNYFLAWTLFPLIFFSFSRNVVWTYAVLSFVPFSYLLNEIIPLKKQFIVSIVSLLIIFFSIMGSMFVTWKEKDLTALYRNKRNVKVALPREHIIDFMTNGTASYY